MKNDKVFRQGDVLILKIEDLPGDLIDVKPDNKRNILAYGEVTGHSHALDVKESKLQETVKGERFLTVPKQALLKHEEHDTIILPKGFYRIIQQVEYQREFRQVVD